MCIIMWALCILKCFWKHSHNTLFMKWNFISREKCLRLNIPKIILRCLLSVTFWHWLKLYSPKNVKCFLVDIWIFNSDNCSALSYNCLERWFPLQSSKWKPLFLLKQMILFAIYISNFVFVSITLLNNFSTDTRLSLYFEIMFMYAYFD